MISIDVDALAAAIAERLQPPAQTRWLTMDEAAEHMRVSRSWLERRREGIPHVRLGQKVLFDSREIDAWLTNHRRG